MKMTELIKNFINQIKNEYSEFKKTKNIKKQIPNLLTLSRAISPFVFLALVSLNIPIAALVSAGLFAVTDFFDGFLARKLKCTSELGVVLDQVCDKIMAGGIALIITPFNPIIACNIALEGIISTITVNSRRKGNINKSSIIGKIKTWFLSSSILFAYACPVFNFPIEIFYTLFGMSIIGQIVTAIDYKHKDIKMDKIKELEAIKNSKMIIEEQRNNLAYTKTKENEYQEILNVERKHIKRLKKN